MAPKSRLEEVANTARLVASIYVIVVTYAVGMATAKARRIIKKK